MKDVDYIDVSDLAKVRIAKHAICDCMFMSDGAKELKLAIIESLMDLEASLSARIEIDSD